MRCPKRLLRPGVPDEIWISLETAIYKDALAKLDEARAVANERFRTPPTAHPTGIYSRTVRLARPDDPHRPHLRPDQAASLAQSFFQRAKLEMDALPLSRARMTPEAEFDLRAELRDDARALADCTVEDRDDPVRGAEITVLKEAGFRCDPASEAGVLLREYLRRAMVQLGALRLARFDGDYADRVSDQMFSGGTSEGAATVRRRSEATFGDAADRYLAEVLDLRNVTPKTALKHRSLLKHIGDFFGRSTAICDLERADCNRFRDTLAKLPPNFAKKGKPGQSLEKIAEINRGGRTLAWETQNNYLTMVDDLLAWCLKERLIPDNVAADISPLKKREAAEMQRLPFTAAELRQIFATPIFTGCVDDERGFAKPGSSIIRRSRYWLPLLGLFSGMRMEEILQLTPDHIRTSPAGTAFIVLTRDMKLKTENAEREIPIHPMLKRVGFLAWVEEKRQGGASELFDDVPVSKHGYRSDIFSKRFATFLKRIGLPAERKSKLCFHSLRHTFKDALNETGAPEGEMDEICGWARTKRQGRRYGSGFDADRLKPYVDRITFDVDLSHLPCPVRRRKEPARAS